MDGSEIVFQVGNSTSHGLFESASSKQNRLFSDTKSSGEIGTIKIRAIPQNLKTSMMATNETRKN